MKNWQKSIIQDMYMPIINGLNTKEISIVNAEVANKKDEIKSLSQNKNKYIE